MFCSGDIGGYPYIVMPGASVLHLCNPRNPMHTVTRDGFRKHLPNPACHQAAYAAGRFEATRENGRDGRRICKVCLSDYQSYAARLSNELHSTMMILRGW